MTKLVKKLLISLMALVMTACLGYALLGTQPITANAATAEYGLWVGGVKVTSDNLVIDGNDNSAITGTATYDAENKTLTLDNFSYTGVGMIVEGAIFCDNSIDSLNIVLKGTNTLTTTGDDWGNSDCGIILEKDNATLRISDYVGDDSTGVLNITSGFYGIKFNGGNTTELTLVNVTLNIDTYWPGIATARYVSITKSTLMIQTGPKANYTAFYQLNGVKFSNGAENYNVYNSNSPTTPVTTDKTHYSTYLYKYIKIEPVEGTPYDVWVAGIQLDSTNTTIDINDNFAVTGSATYDPTSNTLTLDNFVYSGAGYNYTGNVEALIYSTGIDLKIVLKGTNKLVDTVDYQLGIIIENGSLTIAGSDEYSETASLELTVMDLCIYADGSLLIENVKLTTTTTALPNGNGSPIQAIFAYGDLSITSSEVTVIAGDSDGDGIIEFGYTQGIISNGNVTITDSSVNVAANAGGIGAYSSMTIDNSTVIIDGGTCGTYAAVTSITNSTVIISGEIAILTNTMYDGCLMISNSNVEISAQEYLIHDLYYDKPLDDYRLNDDTGRVIYGGEDKESATILTEQADIFTHKYLRFASIKKVTVNYGISELANKEISIEKGETLSLESPEIDGYALIGWYNEDTLETAFDFSTPITEDTTIYAKWAVAYDIWVAGIRLNAENFIIDGNDNSAITGTATYDPTSNTLTLDNFSYTGADYYLHYIEYNSEDDEYYHKYAAIYSKGDLNIVLNGENALNCAIIDEDSDRIYKTCEGISVDGALTIGGGTLNATVIKGNVIVANTLTIDNAILNSNSTGINIFLYGDAIISNSTVFAKGAAPVIAIGYGYELEIINSTVVIQSEDIYGFTNYSAITIDENSVLEISVSYCAIQNTITVNYSPNSVVYAGENKENAQLVAEPDGTTYENKYVKIVPVRKVTVNYGISELANKEISIEKGETLSLESPEIDGYIFIGWYNKDTFETAFDFSAPITEDTTIYAKFANYTQDMADIDSQINDVKGSITSLQSSIDGKADATEFANSVTDLQGKIDALTNNYQSADATQQLEIDELERQVSNLINDTIVLLNSKVTNIETEIANINSAISTNASDIIKNADKITSLTTQLTALQGVVDSLGDTYIDNTELASLKDALELADEGLNDLITALTTRVTAIESEIANINGAISTNASDIIKNADKITSLTTQLTALQGVVNSLGDTYIDNTELANLKAELVDADNQIKGLITALTTRVTDIETEIAKINSAVSTNESDIIKNADKITSLTTQLTALQGVVDSLGDTYIDNTELSSLKDALELADKGLNDLITALTTRVEKTESDIVSLVSNKADVTLVTEKVEELKGLINSLDAVKNNYSTADEELKNQLTTVINNAKQQAIDNATELVNSAKAELTIAINAKADTATVNAKVEELNKAIKNAKTVANAYTDGKVEELNSTIATAKQQAIDSATELVNNAKTELNAAIALKADSATVTAKFTEVQSAIAILQGLSDDYLSADTELKEELTTLIANTKAEIIELIIAGDKVNADAFEEEIAKLRAEIEALKNANNEDVANLRTEIEELKNATNEDIKEAESNAQVLPSVIASVAVLGDIALLVWFIIKRKIVK